MTSQDPVEPSTTEEPSTVRPVDYKGAPLDAEKGPGLGCFWSQVVVLVVFLILTPMSVAWGWPSGVSAGLLIAVLILLLFTGQTIIFLLRLVAADRRATGRRRPLASGTPTVGELEDARRTPAAGTGNGAEAPRAVERGEAGSADDPGGSPGGVRE
ncbi:MAG: hypothetical protein ABIQ17_00225 [Candidatus Limnocylindrales bacterium]